MNASDAASRWLRRLYRPRCWMIYGKFPLNLPRCAAAPSWCPTVASVERRPTNQWIGMVNRPVFFRRALKLVNGGNPTRRPAISRRPGLTVAVGEPGLRAGQLQRDVGTRHRRRRTETHMAAAILADAVTLLSNSWNDATRSSRRTTSAAARRRPRATGLPSSPARACPFPYPTLGNAAVPLRHRRRRRQLPALPGRLAARSTTIRLPRLDRQPVHQPPGDGDVQVQHARLRLQRPQLHLRRRLPVAGAAAAGHADVPRRQHADVQTAAPSEPVDSARLRRSRQTSPHGDANTRRAPLY